MSKTDAWRECTNMAQGKSEMDEKLVKPVFGQDAYRSLLEKIIHGDLLPGETMVMDQLAQKFGLSKVEVRQACTRLRQDRLISYKPNKGYVIPPTCWEDLDDAYRLKLKLEPDAIARGAQRATATDRDACEQAHRAFKSCSGSNRMLRRLGRQFRACLVGPGAEAVLASELDRLNIFVDQGQIRLTNFSELAGVAQAASAQLWALWAAGDDVGACNLARQQLLVEWDVLAASAGRQGPRPELGLEEDQNVWKGETGAPGGISGRPYIGMGQSVRRAV